MPKADLRDGTIILSDVDLRMKDSAAAIPGARWQKAVQEWWVPVSWAASHALKGQFGPALQVTDALRTWVRAEHANKISPSWYWRSALDAPTDPRLPDKLFPYQRAGAAFLATAGRAALFDQPGVGKSAQAIAALRLLGPGALPALIVCPNSVKRTWAREFATWAPEIDVAVVSGSAAQRRKTLTESHSCYIINWESLRLHSRLAKYGSIALAKCEECGGPHKEPKMTVAKCEVHQKELNMMNFRTVIGDEIHRSANPHNAWTRALWALAEKADYRFALTGTPVVNNVADMWSILHFLSPDEFPSRTKFVERYAMVVYNTWGAMEVTGLRPDRAIEYRAITERYWRRMLKEVVLPQLPPVLAPQIRTVTPSVKEAKAYAQMAETMTAELDDDDMMVATTNFARVIRLTQFASSYAEITPEGNVALASPSSKIDAFMEDLADFGDEPLVVFAQSRQLIELLSAELQKGKHPRPHGMVTGKISEIERDQHIRAFQSGQTNLILCTIGAGGIGVTLNRARIAIFLQRSWSMVEMEQALNRVHRIGSEVHESVLPIYYVTPGTIEERQLDVLSGKEQIFQEVLRDKESLRSWLQ